MSTRTKWLASINYKDTLCADHRTAFCTMCREEIVSSESLVTVNVKEEVEWENAESCGVSEEASLADLYAEHEVKDELVIGPETLQPRDVAFATSDTLHQLVADACQQEPAAESSRYRKQSALAECFVRLNRIPVDQILHTCKICGITFDNISSITSHKVIHADANTDATSDMQSLTSKTETFVCDICSKSFKIKLNLIKHIQQHQPKMFACNTCGKLFSYESIFITNDHIGNKMYHCIICERNHKAALAKCFVRLERIPDKHACKIYGRRLDNESRLTSPVVNTDFNLSPQRREICSDATYMCDKCDKSFADKLYLIKHIKWHQQKTFSCSLCKRRFRIESSIITHSCNYSGKQANKDICSCNVCGQIFNAKSVLRNHESIHSNVWPYSCKICKKQFKRKSYLDTHERTHTGERPYKCDTCKKRFTRQHHLVVHRRIHTGEKPYGCEICDKRYAKKYHLSYHYRIHIRERPYSCKICNQQFAFKYSLIIHERIHTGDKLYACKICNKQFVCISHLQVHKRVHSKDQIKEIRK